MYCECHRDHANGKLIFPWLYYSVFSVTYRKDGKRKAVVYLAPAGTGFSASVISNC